MESNATLNSRTTKQSHLALLLVALTSFAAFIGILLSSNTVSADDNTSVVDQINITVPISCTISGTGMNTHNANINNGLYEDDIGSTTLHAFCNDNEGFAIYAAGYTGNEVGGTNSNKLVGTTASNNATIESGIATTAGNPDISNWSMKLAITQDSGDTTGTNAFTIDSAPNVDLPSQAEQGATAASFSSYHVVPNEYTKVAHKNSGTDMTDTTGGVKLTTTYAAYISKTQAADTYSGQVIYTLVHPASQSAPLVCNPNGTTIGTNSSTDIKCMQDFASLSSSIKSTLINNMTLEQTYTLTDKRDEKTYTLAKLKDGNVWMTQNLDLDLDSSTIYTNEDTDLGWNTSTNQYDTASWSPLRSTYNSDTRTWCQGGIWNTQSNKCGNNFTPESYDPGDLYWNGVLSNYSDWSIYRNSCTLDSITHEPTCDESLNPIDTYTTISGTPIPEYHIGNYYNWNAAVAMNDTSTYVTGNQDINQSICPVGWMLPKSGYGTATSTSSGSFRYLFEQYGWNDNTYMMTNPYIWNSAIRLSLVDTWEGSFAEFGYYGDLMSSTIYDSNRVYTAGATADGDVGPDYFYANYRLSGKSVRCIVR